LPYPPNDHDRSGRCPSTSSPPSSRSWCHKCARMMQVRREPFTVSRLWSSAKYPRRLPLLLIDLRQIREYLVSAIGIRVTTCGTTRVTRRFAAIEAGEPSTPVLGATATAPLAASSQGFAPLMWLDLAARRPSRAIRGTADPSRRCTKRKPSNRRGHRRQPWSHPACHEPSRRTQTPRGGWMVCILGRYPRGAIAESRGYPGSSRCSGGLCASSHLFMARIAPLRM
jgi:hypothetical protein